MGMSFERGRILIDAAAPAKEVRGVLGAYAPWCHKLDFTGGVPANATGCGRPASTALISR